MSNSNSKTGGNTFTGLLAIAFIVLKLCNVINWSWCWVLSPIWIPILIVIILSIAYFFLLWLAKIDDRKRIAAGMNRWAWENRKKIAKNPDLKEPVVKSSWQERFEKMQREQSKK